MSALVPGRIHAIFRSAFGPIKIQHLFQYSLTICSYSDIDRQTLFYRARQNPGSRKPIRPSRYIHVREIPTCSRGNAKEYSISRQIHYTLLQMPCYASTGSRKPLSRCSRLYGPRTMPPSASGTSKSVSNGQTWEKSLLCCTNCTHRQDRFQAKSALNTSEGSCCLGV